MITPKEELRHFGVVENKLTPVLGVFAINDENVTFNEIEKCFGSLRFFSIKTISLPRLLNKINELVNVQCEF